MKNFIRIILFSFLMSLGYWGFSNYGIPQIIPEPPPVEEEIGGSITMPQYIALGKKLFNGKGTCTLCHNPVGGRAPLLDVAGKDGPPEGIRAEERIKDPRYKGKAKNGVEYIYESEVDPSAFVVAGYGKAGTNDTVSPMPPTNKGAIGLSDPEIYAIIAYFQDAAGVKVTVNLPTGAPATAAAEEPAKVTPAKTPEEAFAKFACVTCHTIPGVPDATGEIGPNQTGLAKRAAKRVKGLNAEQYIRQSILTPNAYVVKDFDPDVMPQDFAEQMTVKELDMIVKYLLEKTG
ncbi:MAG: c-type cytochrome [Nitrospinota bacterium]|jgi:mono/diheme cytochrome c family protein